MELPHIGDHCSEPTCRQLDFLPLKCDACKGIFCSSHYTYTNHSCSAAEKKNVQVPVCPLCNVPVPSKRGSPPDIAVGLHIDNDCKNRKKIFTNKCSSKGCKTKEVIPVTCSDCGQNFCLKHRHPADHSCIGKEESLRLKRLSALNKPVQNNAGNSSNNFRSLQGTMSEDEALARALQASLQDENQQRQPVRTVPWISKDKCRLS